MKTLSMVFNEPYPSAIYYLTCLPLVAAAAFFQHNHRLERKPFFIGNNGMKSYEKSHLQIMSGSSHIRRVEIVVELGILVFFSIFSGKEIRSKRVQITFIEL